MRTRFYSLAAAALLAAAPACPARAADESPANALLLAPSEKTAFDQRFQDFLNKNGARLTESFPPYAFIGHIPDALDAELGKRYGVKVYREKVDDLSGFFRLNATAVLAANSWNKHFQEDPPAAPVVISHKVNQEGDTKLILRWNEVMKAVSYRLQIGLDSDFNMIALDTTLAGNSFDVYTPFWTDGVYYWRVAGLLVLNNGLQKDGAFSETYSFSVARPAARTKTAAPALPPSAKFRRSAVSWPRDPAFKYYRLQISRTKNFMPPLVDVFTATETFTVAGLPIDRDTPYYMRLMGADNTGPGAWSRLSEIILETPATVAKDKKKRRFTKESGRK
ncbi:MAG TPA: hypothetical protein PKI19_09830 [Elusimicrobiales bacterium]|nr:hypothetical protein [Elusimicrobiales bacterium]